MAIGPFYDMIRDLTVKIQRIICRNTPHKLEANLAEFGGDVQSQIENFALNNAEKDVFRVCVEAL